MRRRDFLVFLLFAVLFLVYRGHLTPPRPGGTREEARAGPGEAGGKEGDEDTGADAGDVSVVRSPTPPGPEVVIIHVDNRNRGNHAFLSLTSLVTDLYAKANPGHHYIYMSYDPADPEMGNRFRGEQPSFCNHSIKGGILGPNGCIINPVWAKVKGLKVAREQFPDAEYLVFLDSDAGIAPKYTNLPFPEMIAVSCLPLLYFCFSLPLVPHLSCPFRLLILSSFLSRPFSIYNSPPRTTSIALLPARTWSACMTSTSKKRVCCSRVRSAAGGRRSA